MNRSVWMRMEDRDGRWRRLESDKTDTLAGGGEKRACFPESSFTATHHGIFFFSKGDVVFTGKAV